MPNSLVIVLTEVAMNLPGEVKVTESYVYVLCTLCNRHVYLCISLYAHNVWQGVMLIMILSIILTMSKFKSNLVMRISNDLFLN